MPLLTIVLPVHGVEPYLRACLDSVLADPTRDVEVVAVDDRSPDGCAAILREYAAADSRLRVLSLVVNVGLGGARNAGFALARGEYVWFVDSDDRVAGGAVAAVCARLRELRPQVLLVDHDRVYEDGTVEPDASSAVLRGVTGVVDLDACPQLLRLQHTAWNKIVSVDLIRAHDLSFPTGWYEDFPFSHPVLLAAERIAVLDRVCYHYRRGRAGAITTSVSARHLEALAQYRHLYALLAARGPHFTRHHDRLFRLVIDHNLAIMGNADRLPGAARREYFRQVVALYREHLPAGGYQRPGSIGGVKHDLVRLGWYPAYAGLRGAWRATRRLRELRRRPSAAAPGAAVPGPRRPDHSDQRQAAIGAGMDYGR